MHKVLLSSPNRHVNQLETKKKRSARQANTKLDDDIAIISKTQKFQHSLFPVTKHFNWFLRDFKTNRITQQLKESTLHYDGSTCNPYGYSVV